MDYKKKIERLEEIVNILESGECGLDNATKLFEEGSCIVKECSVNLEQTKGKITQIKSDLDKLTEIDL